MKHLLTAPVRFYQLFSSMSSPRCKFYPSCSNYAITAISRHGIRGVFMAISRVVRCHPWSHGGVDYVDYDLDSADAVNARKVKAGAN